MQAITINSSSHVSTLETAIQNRLDPPFNNIPLRICQIHPESVVERLMDPQTPISSFFPEEAKAVTEYDSYLVKNWDIETLINFLKEQNLKLDDDDLGILRKQKIDGQVFLDMSKDDFMQAGLEMGPAMKLAKEIQTLKEKPKRVFFSYKSLKEVLAKYGIDSDSTETIPLFLPETHEVQDSNKHFEHCIENILFRMKNYGSLVLDSLESMRNEYVSTILHTALHIAGDIVRSQKSNLRHRGQGSA
ncbi:hypothetical protein GLOIN_2v1587390 [Rhizophagus clarus]|uniref:SAM domain-containing protein n=1 Tax=Rhizophagus clarus TaxID=94130 RepID=A0A8H3QNA4_9GLOM|nr:hypothetical protein GLOIN_2v1587390 [Rhizophagus clarus]